MSLQRAREVCNLLSLKNEFAINRSIFLSICLPYVELCSPQIDVLI